MELKSKSNNTSLFQLVAGPLLNEVEAAFRQGRQAEYLLATNVRRQVWHFWLCACGTERHDIAPHLIYTKSKVLLVEALDSMGIEGTCPGLLNALGKLGQFALFKETYQKLVEIILEGGRGSKFVMHQDILTAEVLDRLHLLPDALRREKIVTGKEVTTESLEKIAFFLKRGLNPGPLINQAELGDVRNILAMMHAQARNCPSNGRLPIAWGGNNTIQPVCSTDELIRLAAKMNNCLDRYWDDLYTGVKALFVLAGGAPVAICFEKIAGIGWELEQVRGPENRLPTRSEYQRIRQGFRSRPDFFIPKEHVAGKLTWQIDYANNDMLT